MNRSSTRSAGASRGLITVSIMLATVMQALDTTIANVALPYMQGSVSATQDQISWVLTSYIVAAAIFTPPMGPLAARFGRKRLFLANVLGFTIASMLCGAAQSLEQIVAFRLLQGAFGAGLVPLSQAVLLDTYPKERHGSAMAMWGVGVMVGPILGPTLGGWLTEYYNWRWVFYINLPFGALAFAGILLFVPETAIDKSRRFDYLGFALLSLAVAALQMMLDRGDSQDWFGSTEIIVETVVAALAFYMFMVHLLTAERPFIPPQMFKDRNFSMGLFFIFMVGVILLATMALLPPFLQNLAGYPALTTGLVLAPRGLGTMTAMLLVGRLIQRIDARALMAAGFAITSYSLWQMTYFTADVDFWTLVMTGVTQGFGLGLIFVPLSTVTFATLAPVWRTDATSMFSLMRNIGSSIGISIVVTLLSRQTQTMHASLAAHLDPFSPALQQPWLPDAWDWHTQSGLMVLNDVVTQQAAMIAYLDDFRFMMWITLLALPCVLLLAAPARRGGATPATAAHMD